MLNFPFFVAKRYLFSKKSHNVINIISWISLMGVAVGTMAFIVILSVFNGFDMVVSKLINTFDPDIRIEVARGKTFSLGDDVFADVLSLPGIAAYSEVVEEQVLLQYADRQVVATIKGVDGSYVNITGVDTMLIDGEFALKKGEYDLGVAGYGIAYRLQVNLLALTPLKVFVPKRNATTTLDPSQAFSNESVLPVGFFSIQSDFDEKYLIVSIEFARRLLGYTTEVSSVEIKLDADLASTARDDLQELIQSKLGAGFVVKNRFEQNASLYKIMQSEKWAVFLILAFILFIASFNVTGSLIMLIVDKEKDIVILRGLGATKEQVYSIFFGEGCLIAVGGALAGLLVGVLICFIQIQFGVISFPHSAIIESYPVELRSTDFFAVFATVVFVGFLAAWFPVRFFTKYFVIYN